MKIRFGIALPVFALWLQGCGDSLKEFPCAEVSGVVLCDGKPVRGAQVYFTPKMTGKSAEVGKPGFSWTGEDGRFVLSTYGDGDGADRADG